jgi:vitamin K-dependent gamma-carboxylase
MTEAPAAAWTTLKARVGQALHGRVDVAWLAAFRILYGTAICISMLRFIGYGWIERLFVRPSFYFKYWGFEWVEPLSGPHMHALFWVLAALALSIALGFAFRVAAPAFALGITYIQLIDVSNYLNHYYLAALLSWLLAISPANRAWSLDAWIAKRFFGRSRSSQASGTVSGAWLWLFRFQVGAVYTFAGLAKAQSDWLFHGQPLRIWLGARTDLPLLGQLFTMEGVPLVMSWCGFLFDTTIVWWLLWRRTRPWAYLIVIVFHVLTRLLFPIGMFPVIMVMSAVAFFSPSWPRNVWATLTRLAARITRQTKLAVEGVSPPSAKLAAATSESTAGVGALGFARPTLARKLCVAVGVLYCAVQLALPFRYLAYGGNVLWHEQGMRFSWRVMLRAKGGSTTFVVRNKQTGKVWYVNPRAYLTGWQESEMSSQPDLILQFAHHLRDDLNAQGLGPVEVRVESRVALNGRRSTFMIDPHVDLGLVADGLAPADWVLPAPSGPPPHTHPVL